MPVIPPVGESWLVTLECQGTVAGSRFLNGITHDGSVALAPDTDPPYSGTRWSMTQVADGVVSLRCMGLVDGPRFLDGRTREGSVGLAPVTTGQFTGTRWAPSLAGADTITLMCLGKLPGPTFLNGLTGNGSVELAPSTNPPYSGTQWRVRVLGKLVVLQCQGDHPGARARFLDGRTQQATVGLAPLTSGKYTGTLWLIAPADNGLTLNCQGTLDGARFLDGRTIGGTVGLVPSTDPPFSGTRWEIAPLADGTYSVRCLGELEGPRYLDGRTIDGSVALAQNTDPPYSGTHWRLTSPSIWWEPCSLGDGAGMPNGAPVEVLSVERVGQLTGSHDPEGWVLLNGDTSLWGVAGVDLGCNTEHEGKLFIFSGDVVPGDRVGGPKRDADFVAWTDATDIFASPGGGFTLNPILDAQGTYFDPITVKGGIGITGRDEVASGAFSHGSKVYVFTHIWDAYKVRPRHSQGCYLISKADPRQPGPFHEEFLFSPRRKPDGTLAAGEQFGGVAPVVVQNAQHPGLPASDGTGLVMFGIGYNPKLKYSATHLAWMPLSRTGRPVLESVLYYTGQSGNRWSPDSEQAVAMFGKEPNLQSISAIWHEDSQQWVLVHMTANNIADFTGPVIARIGATPWGLSDPFNLFAPCREQAFGKYMHWPGLDDIHERCDPLGVGGVDDGPAWAYGAFLLERFTKWDPTTRELDMYYLLSLSSPYQIQVMHTKLQLL